MNFCVQRKLQCTKIIYWVENQPTWYQSDTSKHASMFSFQCRLISLQRFTSCLIERNINFQLHIFQWGSMLSLSKRDPNEIRLLWNNTIFPGYNLFWVTPGGINFLLHDCSNHPLQPDHSHYIRQNASFMLTFTRICIYVADTVLCLNAHLIILVNCFLHGVLFQNSFIQRAWI